MITETTKFYVAPENKERMALYLLLSPMANTVLDGMSNGIITAPDGAVHTVLAQIFMHIPKFQEPVDDLTTVEFTGINYVGDDVDDDASLVGWRYVTTREGKLGVAAKYDEADELQLVAAFALWQTA